MTLNEYQQAALEFDDVPRDLAITYPALGIAGEAGEVADKVKKVFRDHDRDFSDAKLRHDIALEIGDVLWYCAKLSYELGYTLEQIGAMNRQKLSDRRNRGVIHGDGDYR